jgi:isoquinoline 1-oxidoreductase
MKKVPDTFFDVERYELGERGRYRFELPRRDFLRVFSAMGGGLAVIAVARPALTQESGRGGQGRAPAPELAAWIHIGEDGRVTAYTGKVEIGQNIRTSLAQTVGDELRVPLGAITFVMADTELTPFDAGTFGSQTTPRMAPQLAKASATAREMLIDEAAKRWNVDRSTLSARDGKVVAAEGRSVGYGELTAGRKLAGVVSADATPAPVDRWVLRGTAPKKVDGRAFVTGRHEYTPDMTRPGMVHGRVIRPAGYAGTLLSVDDGAARAMPGVAVVRDGEFLGVTAPTEREVRRAAAAVRAQWKAPVNEPTSETIYDHLKKTERPPEPGRSAGRFNSGDVVQARAKATKTFDASYRIPYIAHVPLEPRAAVAEWQGDKLTVWCGTQRPFGVRSELATAFRIPEDRVRVIVPDMGSAYGGKHTGEHAVEAARLAKGAGKPVKLVYTRAEEFSWGYFRPAGVIDIKSAVDADGRLISWEFDNWNSGASAIRTPYDIPNQRIAFHAAQSPLRQGSYRGLAATANHYAREMHMDAIARALGVDAVEFRLKHLLPGTGAPGSDHAERLKAVLNAAAKKSGWPKPSAPGRALGIACGTEKGSFVAAAAELSKAPSGFTIERLIVVFECGAIVNPDGLLNQVEGAVVQGLGGALFESVDFRNGEIVNGSLEQYRVPRFKDMPPIETLLLDRKDLPSAGAGETPIVCVAPAIGSAARAFGAVAEALPVALANS